MLNTLQRYRARTRGEDAELGFTLIELLIVIVVLGILAAVTVFALTNVTGKSAVSACNSDASSVNSAISAYEANNSGAIPTMAQLTAAPVSGSIQYLQSAPNGGTHYAITISASTATPPGVVLVVAPNPSTSPPAAVSYILNGAINTAACSAAT